MAKIIEYKILNKTIKNLAGYTLLISILIIISSCQRDKKELNNIKIELKPSNALSLYDNSKSQFLLLSTSQINRDFYNQNLEKFQGIPKLDSFQILTENVNNFRFYRPALFGKENQKKFLQDSLSMTVNNSKSFINVLSGFKGNDQILILDSNNNYNFSDDKILSFPNNYRFFKNNAPKLNDSLLKIDSLSTLDLNFTLQGPNEKFSMSRKVQLFPIANYYYTQLMGGNNLKEYATIIRFKDGLTGDFIVNQKKIHTYIQGVNEKSISIFIIPNRYLSITDPQIVQENFLYSLKDTIQLINQFYKLNFNLNQQRLELKKIDTVSNKYGNRIGNKLKNYKVKSLNNKTFQIDSLLQNKEFLLIDFWGTWCKPCKELTPELVSISEEYSSKLQILSIASDDSLNVVKEYINENKMEWYQSFISRKSQYDFLNEMNIKSYPTFLLLNRIEKLFLEEDLIPYNILRI